MGRDGGLTRIRGAVQNISELKDLQSQLDAAKAQITLALEPVSDAVITVTCDGKFIYLNRAAQQLLACDSRQLVGKLAYEVYPQLAGTRYHAHFLRAVLEGRTTAFSIYANELCRWLHITMAPSPLGVTAYVRHTARQDATSETFTPAQERQRLVFKAGADAMLIATSADGRITDANEAACALFGKTKAQLRSQSTADLVAPGERRVTELAAQCAPTGRSATWLKMVRSDGSEFESEVAGALYTAADGQSFLTLSIRDVSEWPRLRGQQQAATSLPGERLAIKARDLELANSELKAFAHSLAHDLRQPLSAIGSFCPFLRAAQLAGDSAKVAHYSERIEAAASRMDGYVEGLLSMADADHAPLSVQDVDLSRLAAEIVQELGQQDRTRSVVSQIQQGLLARGDERLLRMLLQNLLSNAWKFTNRTGARISFEAALNSAGEFVYCVSDNGVGFDAAWSHKLFSPFQRLHSQEEFPGVGLGLANSKRIVLRHSGRIWAESTSGRGARIHFTLGPPRSSLSGR